VVTNQADLLAPFRGERYAARDRLNALIAPPYDVISPDERARLAARDPHNIAHLILPQAAPPASDPYAHAAALLADWRASKVLVRDPEPAVYVVAQEFTLPTGERRERIGMLAALRAEPYEKGRVRPHEKTHAGPKADRLALLRATRTFLESIFVLAPDPGGELAGGLAAVAKRPPSTRAELDGVRLRLWVVSGDDASRLSGLASRLPVYIADGHHRYETAIAYARENPAAERLVAFVVSVRDPGLSVLGTHRLIQGVGVDPAKLLEQWRRWFEVGRVAPCADRIERLEQLGRDRTACLVAFPGDYHVTLALKADAPLDEIPELGRTPAVRALDVARVDALVVQALLRSGSPAPTVGYTPDPRVAFDAVRSGTAAAAVLVNPTRIEQVIAVADAGDVMPQKSTFFAPKVPSGVVLLPAE